MPTWIYEGTNSTGTTVSGQHDAGSRRHLERTLRQLGVTVNEAKRAWWDFEIGGNRLPAKQRIIFTELLAGLLRAKVPLPRALDTLQEEFPSKALRNAIDEISIDVQAGQSLADALESHPKLFSRVYIQMIRAGEEAGELVRMLERLAKTLKRTSEIRSKIQMAMIYPSILFTTTLVSALGLMYKVVPTFEDIFTRTGMELPRTTELMLAFSRGLREHAIPLAISSAVFALALMASWRNPDSRRRIDRGILAIPALGKMVQIGATANFCRVFSTLLASKINNVQALTLATETIDNTHMQHKLRDRIGDVARGGTIAIALRDSKVVPRILVTVASVGEESGELPTQIDNAADLFEEDAIRQVDRVKELLPPILVLAVCGMVATLLIGVYLPMFMSITKAG